MSPITPEEKAREAIDDLLEQAGWIIYDYKKADLTKGIGQAIREVPMRSGRADYLLVCGGKAVGVIEAKKAGTTLTSVQRQLKSVINDN